MFHGADRPAEIKISQIVWNGIHIDETVLDPVIEDGAWVAAFARVAPGLRVAQESIVAFGAVLLSDTEPRGIYVGNPATLTAIRRLRDELPPVAELEEVRS